MLAELSRRADRWELQASPASLKADTVALEWPSRQKLRAVGPHRPVHRSVRGGADPVGEHDRCLGPLRYAAIRRHHDPEERDEEPAAQPVAACVVRGSRAMGGSGLV
jgi:hypothetical protein